ncbi:MAG: hypothetical protein PHP64_02135 [Actinomycetota bacterium]|nr:hypothetical protein [Actinomycetota bacterium]
MRNDYEKQSRGDEMQNTQGEKIQGELKSLPENAKTSNPRMRELKTKATFTKPQINPEAPPMPPMIAQGAETGIKVSKPSPIENHPKKEAGNYKGMINNSPSVMGAR